MSVPTALRFTYEDYVLLPEDRRYEVVSGELVVTPAPTPFHQVVLGRIWRLLDDHVGAHGLGRVLLAPCDVVLSKFDVLQPDILFISTERRPIIGEKYVGPAPDLVVEVLSPYSTADRDRTAKAKRYATFGVREMWLVDPEARTIEVFVNTAEGFRREALYGDGDPVRAVILSGLEFRAEPIFREI
jgi:Uma2 family endonuclease